MNSWKQVRSPANPTLRYVRRVAARRGPDGRRALLLEGRHLLAEALATRLPLEVVVASESFARSPEGAALATQLSVDARVLVVPDAVFRRLADVRTPQGVLAVAPRPRWAWEDLTPPGPSTLLVLEAVQDPGNVGTLLRTAAAFGAAGAVVAAGTADPYGPKCVRASQGACLRFPVVAADTGEAVAALRAAGFELLATVPAGGESLDLASWGQRVAVLLGGEGGGLSPALRDAADRAVTVPMPGGVESLNVAISGAIVLYEILRRRRAEARVVAGSEPVV
ncbi:MAG: RNA methyltransferase [Clostridia bacterium]|nr:RNA methyltransferase [Clostridia bacterium]